MNSSVNCGVPSISSCIRLFYRRMPLRLPPSRGLGGSDEATGPQIVTPCSTSDTLHRILKFDLQRGVVHVSCQLLTLPNGPQSRKPRNCSRENEEDLSSRGELMTGYSNTLEHLHVTQKVQPILHFCGTLSQQV